MRCVECAGAGVVGGPAHRSFVGCCLLPAFPLRPQHHNCPSFAQVEDNVEILAAGDEYLKLEGEGAAAGSLVEASSRVTTRYMTKYEKARILGTRALQLR